MLINIPCTLMRGGTSKGPYFHAKDLPSNPTKRDQILLAVMGSPHWRQIDGIGGGDTLTSKVVIVSPSERSDIDIEYLFAQVSVENATVDTMPNCGNMLSGVGPFAIEAGLVKAKNPTTQLRILNANTGKIVEAVVQTPDGQVTYEGIAIIDGVPCSGAPILLNFLDAAGAKTGRLFPTGRRLDVVDGIEISCLDFSSPLVFVPASVLGKTAYESKKELDNDLVLKERLESIRCQVAKMAGFGDVSDKVLPKIALVAPPQQQGVIAARYFTPWTCHSAFAVTGALCLAAATSIPGTVAARVARLRESDPALITIEHPAGTLDIQMREAANSTLEHPVFASAGLIRTARRLFEGNVHILTERPISTCG